MINPDSRVNQICSDNKFLAHVFHRYDIDCESGESIQAAADRRGIHGDFLVTLSQAYFQPGFSISSFDDFSIPVLVEYLKQSHKYYMESRIPEVEQRITSVYGGSNDPMYEVLLRYFRLYKVSLVKHFNLEENELFPHAATLYNRYYFYQVPDRMIDEELHFSVQAFVDHHHEGNDDDELLGKVRNRLNKYIPVMANQSAYRLLLESLDDLAKDLSIHGRIEDEVLVPKLDKLESILKI